MMPDEHGFKIPVIDGKSCVSCGLCESVCPVLNRDKIASQAPERAIAVRSRNPGVLQRSTSGGIVYEAAKTVIESGGIVFAACYGRDFVVEHRRLESIEDLNKMQGSKYVQSDISGSFRAVKQLLSDSERPVLFIGTSCQAAALKSFLGKSYDNLFLIDLICHGVPSPGMWARYIAERKLFGAENIYFRYKMDGVGWESNPLFWVKKHRRCLKEPFNENDFSYLFVNNYSIRTSCFDCPFKTGKRFSDLTCGDLWGIKEMLPGVTDDRGMSLLLINTGRGMELFQRTRECTEYYEVDYSVALRNNLMLIKSVKPPQDADAFWADYAKYSIRKLYKKFRKKDPFILRIKKLLYPLKQRLTGKINKTGDVHV